MKFKVGTTYFTRSIGDHNCIFSARIVSRTPKTVMALVDGKTTPKRFRPYIYEGVEQIRPHGNYSFAPTISADKSERPLKDWEREAPARI